MSDWRDKIKERIRELEKAMSEVNPKTFTYKQLQKSLEINQLIYNKLIKIPKARLNERA